MVEKKPGLLFPEVDKSGQYQIQIKAGGKGSERDRAGGVGPAGVALQRKVLSLKILGQGRARLNIQMASGDLYL